MSEQPQEETQAAPEAAPDDTQEHEPTPDESTPDEHSSGMEAADEMEEAQEAEDAQTEQVEGVPAEPQALSQKQLEAAFGKLERETERHGKRVADIMGDDFAMMEVCPLCEPLMPGFVMDTPALADRFPTVRMLMGDAQPAEYEQDPNIWQCKSCKGKGMQKTGSEVDGQEALVCTDCGGKGWQGQRATAATSGPMAVQPLPDANGQSEVTPQGPEPPEAAKLRAMGYLVAPLAPV